MIATRKLLLLAALVGVATAKIYFKEDFNDDGWSDRWVESQWKPRAEIGNWVHTAGKWSDDFSDDKGIQTGADARFYGLTAAMEEAFDNEGKDLVLQFSVKNEQQLDCGGGYLKLLPAPLDQEEFGGDSKYYIMFGPDICGSATQRTHVIVHYDRTEKNLLVNEDVRCETDRTTHLYTLHVKPDNTYEVFIDQKSVRKGKLAEDFDFLPPKQIKDPEAKKPEDWVDEAKIADPEDVKPEGYDDIPQQIPDPEAEMPEDWDEDEDGEWEPPMMDNPEWKGEWKPKMIDNPDYKGPWVHPEIDNPDYFEDDTLYHVNVAYVGFELWQVKSGTVFDDIIVTDSLDEAIAYGEQTWGKKVKLEKKAFDAEEEEKRKAAEEERKRREAEEAEDDEDEEEEDELDDELEEPAHDDEL
eukprot:PLAT15897.1.p1 GENE.PLAT15897.1~~PLAT15897.1.p1  ORF type:complete len:411 (+),score=222.48 PLAT15897.1:40-1272(+)